MKESVKQLIEVINTETLEEVWKNMNWCGKI